MPQVPCDLKIILKGEDNTHTKEFKGVYESITLSDDCITLSSLVSQACKETNIEPEEIIIKARYQWK